jgi:serine/threonine protein kinase
MYMAPELYPHVAQLYKEHEKGRVDPMATDIWAIGEIVNQLLTRRAVFTGSELIDYVLKGMEFPRRHMATVGVTMNCQDFISSAMARLPKDRPTAEEAWNHKWFTQAMVSHRPSKAPEDMTSSR